MYLKFAAFPVAIDNDTFGEALLAGPRPGETDQPSPVPGLSHP